MSTKYRSTAGIKTILVESEMEEEEETEIYIGRKQLHSIIHRTKKAEEHLEKLLAEKDADVYEHKQIKSILEQALEQERNKRKEYENKLKLAENDLMTYKDRKRIKDTDIGLEVLDPEQSKIRREKHYKELIKEKQSNIEAYKKKYLGQ